MVPSEDSRVSNIRQPALPGAVQTERSRSSGGALGRRRCFLHCPARRADPPYCTRASLRCGNFNLETFMLLTRPDFFPSDMNLLLHCESCELYEYTRIYCAYIDILGYTYLLTFFLNSVDLKLSQFEYFNAFREFLALHTLCCNSSTL